MDFINDPNYFALRNIFGLQTGRFRTVLLLHIAMTVIRNVQQVTNKEILR